MNVKDVAEAVARIEAAKGDDEHAHVLEDRLYVNVLQAIAAGADNPQALAAEALKADRVDFPRWYA